MEKKRNIFFICLLLICLFLVLTAILIIWDHFLPANKHNSGIYHEKEIEVGTKDTILGITEDYGQDYIDRIIFLGESTTYGLQSYGVLSNGKDTTQVWTGATCKNGITVSSGTLSLSPAIGTTKIFYPDTRSAKTVSDALKAKKPEYLIITLGLNNGASYYSEQEFKDCYRILLNSINDSQTDTRVILQSLFPVSKECSIKAYTPERLRLCNKWIYDIAQEYDLKYLNTTEVLEDDKGYLIADYDNGGDGIHLNRAGLSTVIEYIKTHGYPKE